MIGKLGILAGLATLQATVFAIWRIGVTGPDLVLVFLVVWASRLRLRDALILTFAGGLFLDLLSLLPTGSTALGLLPAIFALDYWKTGLTRINLPVMIVTVWLATLGKSFALLFVASQMSYQIPLDQIFDITALILLYNSLIMFIYSFLQRLFAGRQLATPTTPVI